MGTVGGWWHSTLCVCVCVCVRLTVGGLEVPVDDGRLLRVQVRQAARRALGHLEAQHAQRSGQPPPSVQGVWRRPRGVVTR